MSERQARTKRHNSASDKRSNATDGDSSRAKSISPFALRSPTIQTKLKVNSPGDLFEQQADEVADLVMGASSLATGSPPAISGGASNIQRQEVPDDDTVQLMQMPEDETIQRQDMPEDDTIQRDGDGNPRVTSHASATIQNPSGGSPLPTTVRQSVEPHLGADLGDVRVHNDANAAQAASDLRARAFTYDNHIFLNRTESSTDLRLMAHESTHVVQQGGVVRRQPQDEDDLPPQIDTPLSSTATTIESTIDEATAPMTSSESSTVSPSVSMPETADDMATSEAQTDTEEEATLEEETATSEAETDASEGEGGAAGDAGTPTSGEGGAEVELIMPEPPSNLSPAAQGRLQGVQSRVASRATANQTVPPASTNVSESRGAVTEPEEEAQGRAENTVVHQLEQGEPSPEIEELCERIREVIRSKRPPDEDSLVDADPQEMAEASGEQLNSQVEGDAQRVQGEYGEMEGEQEGQPAQEPSEMSPQPEAEGTANIDAGQGAPDAVPVSLDDDAELNKQRIEDAGMNSPVAQEVQSGPIAEAREAQGELEETAARDPAEVLAEQDAAITTAQSDMAGLQAQAQEALARSRAEATSGTENQQNLLVGSEEEIRRNVGAEANRIFTQAQTDVQAQLRPLPTTAMEMWDSGIQRHSTTFENSLSEVERWIEERHSGVGGAILGAWDAVTGLPDWVTRAYNNAEEEFGDNVCSLIREISGAVNVVIENCQRIITTANEQITALFDRLRDQMPEWAAEQQAEFQGRIDGLRNDVKSTRDDVNNQLRQRASQAVQEVRERIDALRDAAKGLIGRIADAIGEFIDDPVRAIINGLLDILGINPASFWALVNRIESVIADIADDPMNFANNLMEALKQGFQRFFDNIGTHLFNGLIEWLFSSMGSVGVTIPSDFSLKSIITFFLQLMGITWERIRRLLAKHIGEENVALIEQAWELVNTLIEQGPQGIFDMIKDQLNPQTILDMIIDTAIDFIVETLIKQVTMRIIGMLNPAGAIVQAVELIYKLLKWLFENAARIFSLIETIVGGVADILAGNIGGMAEAVEGALARILPIVIDFLAGLMGLGDLPNKIADKVKTMQQWIEGILDRVIGWLADRARALLRALGIGGAEEEEEVGGDTATRWSQGMAQVRVVAHQADEQNLNQSEINSRLQPIQEQYRFAILNATQHEGKLQIHASLNPEDWVEIDGADEPITEESLWESIAQQVTTAGPPEFLLSESSASMTRRVLEYYINASSATPARKATVTGLVSQRIQSALDSRDSHQIYVYLAQAGGIVNSLYSSAPAHQRPNIQIHHEQEVAEYPDTFVETRTQRMYVDRPTQRRVRDAVANMSGLTPQQQEQRRADIIQLVKEQLFDQEHDAMEAPLDEIDLIALTRNVHIQIHRRRNT